MIAFVRDCIMLIQVGSGLKLVVGGCFILINQIKICICICCYLYVYLAIVINNPFSPDGEKLSEIDEQENRIIFPISRVWDAHEADPTLLNKIGSRILKKIPAESGFNCRVFSLSWLRSPHSNFAPVSSHGFLLYIYIYLFNIVTQISYIINYL